MGLEVQSLAGRISSEQYAQWVLVRSSVESPLDLLTSSPARKPIDDLDPLIRPIRALDSLLQYGFQIALRTLPVFGENNHSTIIPLRGRA